MRWIKLCAALGMGALGCASPFESKGVSGKYQQVGAVGHAPSARLIPAGPENAASVMTRIHVEVPCGEGTEALWVKGALTDSQWRAFTRGETHQGVLERAVKVYRYCDEGLWLVPSEALEPDEMYAIAIADPPFQLKLRVASSEALPRLRRVWPLEAMGERFGLWCGDEPLHQDKIPARLSPSGMEGVFETGVGNIGERCVRFEAAEGTGALVTGTMPQPGMEGSGISPASIVFGGAEVTLDPILLRGGPLVPLPAVTCAEDEAKFGPGCARWQDTHLIGRSPARETLWAISGAGQGGGKVFWTLPSAPFRLDGLTPESEVLLSLWAIDGTGHRTEDSVRARTLAPMPHLVLNEVLAAPKGPEPQQEWIEIVNWGLVAADLSDYVLVDDRNGSTLGGDRLPGTLIKPFEYVLLVNETFDAFEGSDPRIPDAVQVVRIPKLTKRGLPNEGVSISLKKLNGQRISQISSVSRTKKGASIARVAPDFPDGSRTSFGMFAPTPGTENKP